MKRNTNVVRTKQEVLGWAKELEENSLTLKEIDKKYQTDSSYQFKKFGIKPNLTKNKLRKGRYKLYNTFKENLGAFEAYYLGWLLSDGTLNPKHYQTKITVKKSDVRILEVLKNKIMPDSKIYTYKNNKNFIINSKEFYETMLSLGVEPTKTLKELKIPTSIPKQHLRHFIRGYFEGDGSVFYDKKALRFNICSPTKNILLEIQSILTEEGFNVKLNVEKRKGKVMNIPGGKTCIAKHDMYRIFIRQKKDFVNLYNYLYEDCGEFYLKRKKLILEQYVNTELT